MTKNYREDKDEKCTHDMSYEFNHALLTIIQKTTGQQTHEIMNTIIAEMGKFIADIGIDFNKKSAGATWTRSYWGKLSESWCSTQKRRNRMITYPNTSIIFNLVLTASWSDSTSRYVYKDGIWKSETCDPNRNHVVVKVSLPNKTIKFTTDDMTQVLAEGDILDSSSDIEDVKIRESKAPVRKQKAEKKLKQKRKKSTKKVTGIVVPVTKI